MAAYRTPEAQGFYEMAFDEIARRLGAPPWMRRAIHGLNAVWFRAVRLPGPALGNILMFGKRPSR